MVRAFAGVALLAALALAGCKTTEEIAREDNEQCKSMGIYPGTPGYPECRMFLVQQRNQQQRAAMNAWALMEANKPAPAPAYAPPRSIYCMPVGASGITCN